MKKIILASVIGIFTLTISAGCSSNLPSYSNGNEFGILSESQNGNGKNFQKMGRGLHFFLKDLNLTDSQKQQLQEIGKEMKESFQNNKGNREEAKNAIKEAFLSNSIDKEALISKLESFKPEFGSKLDKISENILKVYNILTPEQRSTLENKMNDMESKFKSRMGEKSAKKFNRHEKKLAYFATKLELSDSQKQQLKGIMKDGKPNRKEMFEKFNNTRKAVLSELKTGNANKESIKNVIESNMGDIKSKMLKPIDKMIEVHGILTPEQRVKLVNLLEENKKEFNHKRKHSFHF